MPHRCIFTSRSLPVLLCSDLLLIFVFSLPFDFMAKSSHGATDGRIRAESCHLFGREDKNGSKCHRHLSCTIYGGLTSPPLAAGGVRMPQRAL